MGAVLKQLVSDTWQPLAFFNKSLRPAERNFSTFDCELLALYLPIQHFRYFLEGREFTAYMDHKPLTFAFVKVSEPWSAQQQRHLAAIFKYTTCIKQKSGKSNLGADALSRVIINAVDTPGQGIDITAMAAAQQDDQEMDTCMQLLTQGCHSRASNLALQIPRSFVMFQLASQDPFSGGSKGDFARRPYN